MKQVTLRKLMEIEKTLLEMESSMKFELSFNDAFELNRLLKEIGEITDYSFQLQNEFNNHFKDDTKLLEYHNKILGEKVNYDVEKALSFINKHKNE